MTRSWGHDRPRPLGAVADLGGPAWAGNAGRKGPPPTAPAVCWSVVGMAVKAAGVRRGGRSPGGPEGRPSHDRPATVFVGNGMGIPGGLAVPGDCGFNRISR
jgi:hypothetical protein